MLKKLLEDSRIKAAMDFIKEDEPVTLRETLEIAVIPAPSNFEEKRTADVLSRYKKLPLASVKADSVGNVYGTLKGTSGRCVILTGHLDIVFPEETPLEPKTKDGIIYCPGIVDDTRAVAEVLAVCRAIVKSGIKPVHDIVFCANVGEEGLGDLRGTRQLFKDFNNVAGFITVDGANPAGIVRAGVGSKRYKVVFSGSGGHSFGAFGIPNPVHAMGRAIAKISNIKVSKEPKTTYNVGVVSGGTSINSISESATMLLDLRSVNASELAKLNELALSYINEAVAEENAHWNHEEKISVAIEAVGDRPAGSQPVDCDIMLAAEAAIRAIGQTPVHDAPSSTDANIPISLGIPALCVGSGGDGGDVHTVAEWFNPKDAYLGTQKNMLLILALAGVSELIEPAVK